MIQPCCASTKSTETAVPPSSSDTASFRLVQLCPPLLVLEINRDPDPLSVVFALELMTQPFCPSRKKTLWILRAAFADGVISPQCRPPSCVRSRFVFPATQPMFVVSKCIDCTCIDTFLAVLLDPLWAEILSGTTKLIASKENATAYETIGRRDTNLHTVTVISCSCQMKKLK